MGKKCSSVLDQATNEEEAEESIASHLKCLIVQTIIHLKNISSSGLVHSSAVSVRSRSLFSELSSYGMWRFPNNVLHNPQEPSPTIQFDSPVHSKNANSSSISGQYTTPRETHSTCDVDVDETPLLR